MICILAVYKDVSIVHSKLNDIRWSIRFGSKTYHITSTIDKDYLCYNITNMELASLLEKLNGDYVEKENDFESGSGYHVTIEIPEFEDIKSDSMMSSEDMAFDVSLQIVNNEHCGYCSEYEDSRLILDPLKNGTKTITIYSKNNDELYERCKNLQYVSTCYGASSAANPNTCCSGYCTLLCWCKVINICEQQS